MRKQFAMAGEDFKKKLRPYTGASLAILWAKASEVPVLEP